MWALAMVLIILCGVAVWLIAAGAAQIEHKKWETKPAAATEPESTEETNE